MMIMVMMMMKEKDDEKKIERMKENEFENERKNLECFRNDTDIASRSSAAFEAQLERNTRHNI